MVCQEPANVILAKPCRSCVERLMRCSGRAVLARIPLPPGEGAAKRRVRGENLEGSCPHPALRATFSRREKDTAHSSSPDRDCNIADTIGMWRPWHVDSFGLLVTSSVQCWLHLCCSASLGCCWPPSSPVWRLSSQASRSQVLRQMTFG